MKTLCLVVIARNESRSIERCLRSFAPHVARMLVLDTGSSDDTVALAKAAGAQVASFKWVDDFAAARNAALDLAAADWHLVADADEWLKEGAQSLHEWRQRAGDRLGKVLVHNQYDANGTSGVVTARVPRLLPGHVRYRGRIHEQPDSTLAQIDIDLHFGHDGYCEAQRARKAGRNEMLLRAALTERPDEPYLLYQLGCELAAWQSYDKAVLKYSLALELTPELADYRADLVRRYLTSLQVVHDWDTAIKLLERETPKYAASRSYMLAVGNLFWNWAQDQPAQAPALLPMAGDAWMQVLHLGTASAAAEPGHQLEQAGVHAALSLQALYSRLGQADRAEQFAALAQTLKSGPGAVAT
jgi:glycosyltransferase involved in cell wall biosynthesis